MATPREVNMNLAKLAEQAALYDDMVEYMVNAVSVGCELNKEERRLLAKSFIYAIGPRRTSWRIVSATERSEEVRSDPTLVDAVREYKKKIESEIYTACKRFISLLDSKCIQSAVTPDEKVYYNKLKGDFYRCISEICKENPSFMDRHNVLRTYMDSQALANTGLDILDPARVQLELTYALYKYEILKKSGHRSIPQTGEVFMLVEQLQDKLASWKPYKEEEN
ncbi:hypothetical protein V2J09_011080 [Rumex salicifolius]